MAARMKREHPGWGALTVRLHLAQALGKDIKEMQTISAQFEPETDSFRLRTQQGETIKTLPARGLDKGDICAFRTTTC